MQEDRYRRILQRMLRSEAAACELKERGLTPDCYSTHSIRKGAVTFACAASTACSAVTVQLRAGWTLGTVQDTYVRYEEAGDQYVGRVVAGLPSDEPDFAVLCPTFVTNTGQERDLVNLVSPVITLHSHYAAASCLRWPLLFTTVIFSASIFHAITLS